MRERKRTEPVDSQVIVKANTMMPRTISRAVSRPLIVEMNPRCTETNEVLGPCVTTVVLTVVVGMSSLLLSSILNRKNLGRPKLGS